MTNPPACDKRLVLATLAALVCALNAGGEPQRVADRAAFAAAAGAARPGTTIELAAGVYPGGVTLIGLRGSEERPIVLRSAGGGATLRGGRDALMLDGCEWLVVEDLRFEGATRAGLLIHASRHVTVRNCRVADNGRWGIQTCLSDNIRIEKCDVEESRREHGIYFSTTDRPAAVGCRIRDNAGCGIHLNGDAAEGGDGMITGAVITGNTITGNGRSGGAAINGDGLERSRIAGNTILTNHAGGIALFRGDAARAGSDNAIVSNRVEFASGVGRYGIQVLGVVTNVAIEDNAVVCGRGPPVELDAAARPGVRLQGNRLKRLSPGPLVGEYQP